MPDLIRPKALKKGDTIGITATGSYVDQDRLKVGRFLLEANGYQVRIHPNTFQKHKQSAGTSGEKAKALHDLLLDDEIDAIILAAGGNRTLHMLDELDLNICIHNPKIIMGFSDCTALLGAITSQTGIVTFHGPTVTWFAKKNLEYKHLQINAVFDLLQGKQTGYPLDKASILKKGKAEGPLIGGNLSLMMHMINTKWCPDLDGALLYLEDTGDELSWIDRDLWYLRELGILKYLSGLILGGFSLGDTGRPFEFTLDEIITEHLQGIDIPVVTNAPFGHNDMLYPLPFGIKGQLDTTGDEARLTYECPVDTGLA